MFYDIIAGRPTDNLPVVGALGLWKLSKAELDASVLISSFIALIVRGTFPKELKEYHGPIPCPFSTSVFHKGSNLTAPLLCPQKPYAFAHIVKRQFGQLLYRVVPPFNGEQISDCLFIKTELYQTRWDTANDCVRGDILCHN